MLKPCLKTLAVCVSPMLISGGSLISMLSSIADSKGVDFSKWWVFFVDERNVPHSSADSNYKGAQDALLGRVGIPPAQVRSLVDSVLSRGARGGGLLAPCDMQFTYKQGVHARCNAM